MSGVCLVQWIGSVFEQGLRDSLGVSAKAAAAAQRQLPVGDLAYGSRTSQQSVQQSPFPALGSSTAAQVDVAAAAPAGFDDVFTDTETAQSKVDRPSDSKHESKPLLLC